MGGAHSQEHTPPCPVLHNDVYDYDNVGIPVRTFCHEIKIIRARRQARIRKLGIAGAELLAWPTVAMPMAPGFVLNGASYGRPTECDGVRSLISNAWLRFRTIKNGMLRF